MFSKQDGANPFSLFLLIVPLYLWLFAKRVYKKIHTYKTKTVCFVCVCVFT